MSHTVLHGFGEELLKMVSKGATSKQWAEWLRVPLEHAVVRGDKKLTECLLRAGANGGAGWKGCHDRTLLQAAGEGGNEDAVSALIEKAGSAELDAISGEKNMTALHRASEGGHTAAARVLMVEGANVGLLDTRQRSALHYAVERGKLHLFRDLMIAGADLSVKDSIGNTPLHLAAGKGHENIVRTMLRRGCSTEVANHEGQHALHVAIIYGHVAVAKELLAAGADPDVLYGKRKIKSPLYLARFNEMIARVLIENGADLKSTDVLGFTALHAVVCGGSPSVVEALLESGADVEARSSRCQLQGCAFDGITPLHITVFFRDFANMSLLLQKGANISAKYNNGKTSLHLVCELFSSATSAEVADYLLRRGADEMLVDNDGRLAVDLVEDSGADPSVGRLKRLLINAPIHRTWRRRGMLIMCRSRSASGKSGGREEKAEKILRHGEDTGTSPAASAGDTNGDGSLLLARVVGMDDDAVFRAIIGFL